MSKPTFLVVTATLALLSVANLFVFLAPSIPTPIDSHYFVANLPNLGGYDVEVQSVYHIIRTPVYNILENLFTNQRDFVIATHLSFSVLIITLFFLTHDISGRNAVPAALATVTIVFLPGIFGSLSDVLQTPLLASLHSYYYPSHFGFDRNTFTVRSLSGIFMVLGLYFFISKQLLAFFASLLAVYFVHPNNAIALAVSYLAASTILFLYFRDRKFYQISIGVVIVVFTIILVANTSVSSLEAPTEAAASFEEWYFAALKDEIDDFSLIYHQEKFYIYIIFLLCILSLLLKSSNGKEVDRKLFYLGVLSLTPALIFGCALILEWALVHLKLFFLAGLIIPSQIGLKALQLGFLPLMLLVMRALFTSHYSIRKKIVTIILIFISVGALVALLVKRYDHMSFKGEQYEHLFNRSSEQNFYGMISFDCSLTGRSPLYRKMFDVSGDLGVLFERYRGHKTVQEIRALNEQVGTDLPLDANYEQNFSSCEALDEVYSLITKSVPLGASLIVPPYMPMLRDILSDNSLFFVDKHDGNLSLGSRFIYSVFARRAELLLGVRYPEMISMTSGLMDTQTRHLFTQRTADDFKLIHELYPDYRFLVTEATHSLELPLIVRGQFFAVYALANFP